METIEDIVREMREQGKHNKENVDLDWLTEEVGDLQLRIADRIEAAVKHQFRDTTKMIHEEVAVAENATTTPTREKSSQVGNAAAMRAALSDACYAMFNFLKTQNGGYEEMANALDKAKATLAKPPRNCDVFEGHTVEGEFEKAMGFPPPETADERNEIMRENWFLFKLWLYAEAKGGVE